jgi:hypothetical protein
LPPPETDVDALNIDVTVVHCFDAGGIGIGEGAALDVREAIIAPAITPAPVAAIGRRQGTNLNARNGQLWGGGIGHGGANGVDFTTEGRRGDMRKLLGLQS